MALNIKDPETDRLARALAAEAGESLTTAIKTAIQDRLIRMRAHPRHDAPTTMAQIIERGRTRTTVDDRCEDDILGYGTDGLPRRGR